MKPLLSERLNVNEYLKILSDNLKILPEEERKSIIDEIEVDLNDRIRALKEEGYNKNEAIEKMFIVNAN